MTISVLDWQRSLGNISKKDASDNSRKKLSVKKKNTIDDYVKELETDFPDLGISKDEFMEIVREWQQDNF
ncbi:MAG: hypothetical protein GF364_03760 [Candidatus Lokiarchaeota archaeon]|nr:hypothetical protein [Candidatus Lokiarchaeota archaeon]